MTMKHRQVTDTNNSTAAAYQLLQDGATTKKKKKKKSKQEKTVTAPVVKAQPTVNTENNRVTSLAELLDDTPQSTSCCGLFNSSKKPVAVVAPVPVANNTTTGKTTLTR